jgi:oxygen-independent coproporphyrinogen-3 oxidase
MAGIYIHIPFCTKACNYCDFHFSTSLNNKTAFVEALLKEISIQKNYFPEGEIISTVYFGGGTPSLLTAQELGAIFKSLYKSFKISDSAEITLEANPDDLSAEKLTELKSAGVNRLSIGVQSFYDEDLLWMNRAHSSAEAIAAIKNAQAQGFDNITIDLIYGVPTLTEHKWRNNLQIAFALDIQHISAYCLTVEKGTALYHDISRNKSANVDEDQGAEQFEIMLEAMKNGGFVQYEISNFCKPGWHSRHNSNYWLKEKYLGLGPSAHSFNGFERKWNIANNAVYIRSLNEGLIKDEKEVLTDHQQYNEYVMTSLRTMWGTDLMEIGQRFGKEAMNNCLKDAEKYISSGDLIKKENKLILSDKGKLIADRIAADLFIEKN